MSSGRKDNEIEPDERDEIYDSDLDSERTRLLDFTHKLVTSIRSKSRFENT